MNYQLISDKIEGILDELFIPINEENYKLIKGIVASYLINEYDVCNDSDIRNIMFKLFDKVL